MACFYPSGKGGKKEIRQQSPKERKPSPGKDKMHRKIKDGGGAVSLGVFFKNFLL